MSDDDPMMGGHIPGDLPVGQQLGRVWSLATQYRGPILDQLVAIDLSLVGCLALYFANDPVRQGQLADQVLLKMSLEQKIDLFSKVTGGKYADLAHDLDDLRGVRNDLVHGRPDTSEDALPRAQQDGEITFINIARPSRRRVLTAKSTYGLLVRCTNCFLRLEKIRQGG